MKVSFGLALRAMGTKEEIDGLVNLQREKNKAIAYAITKPSSNDGEYGLDLVTKKRIGDYYGSLRPEDGKKVMESIKEGQIEELEKTDGINKDLTEFGKGGYAYMLKCYVSSIIQNWNM